MFFYHDSNTQIEYELRIKITIKDKVRLIVFRESHWYLRISKICDFIYFGIFPCYTYL